MIFLLLSNDKLCSRAWQRVAKLQEESNLVPICVKTNSFYRTLKMIRKTNLKAKYFLKMLAAEVARESQPKIPFKFEVRSKSELSQLLEEHKPKACIMYRCGLIIDKPLLSKVPFYNIHSASLPKYGGIASIARALENGDIEQKAVCHEVVPSIDSGKIIAEFPYSLSLNKNYLSNEDAAYRAGEEILFNFVKSLPN